MTESKELKGLKASERYRITATVLEILEKAQFETQDDTRLQESVSDGRWKMVVRKEETNLDELDSIRKELGAKFCVNVMPKDKSMLVISIEASTEDFKALIKTTN